MTLIEAFLEELDRRWKPSGGGKITLKIIGSAALILQTDYARRTKDGDVLETAEISPEIKERLLALGGVKSELQTRYGLYLDVVVNGLPFLPHAPKFHPVAGLGRLAHFRVEVLDIVDVAVSKLKRFNSSDEADVAAMIERGKIAHKRLVARFESAVERFAHDARGHDLPKIVANLHRVERDYFAAGASDIDLPDWIH